MRIVGIAALTLTPCFTFPTAEAQPFYGVVYRPSGVEYDVITTRHFDIIYQRGFDRLALRVADVAEDAYPEVARRAGVSGRFHLPIVINGYNDASNGFVSPLPFRMEIDAAPIKGKILNPRHEDWIAQVVPHELAHAVQAEIRGGFGVGEIVRFFSPDWGRALNLGVPRGITEGFAVSHESRDPTLGRLNYSFTMMQARAAASSRPWTLSQVLDPPGHTRPFDRFYVGGGVLFEYLSDSLRRDFLSDAARFYNRWPFLGFGVAMWQSFGIPPWKLNDRFIAYATTALSRPDPDDHNVLTDEPGLACRRPKWIDNQTIVAFCSGYNLDRGFYSIDENSGRRSLLSRQAVTEDYFVSVDSRGDELLFAEYQPLHFTDESFLSRLRRLHLGSGRVSDIDGSDRLYAPVRIPDGSILAIENDGQFSEIVRVDESGDRNTFLKEDGVRFLEVDVNDGGELVALVNRAGLQFLEIGSISGEGLDSLSTLLSPSAGSIYDPSWSPDGEAIVFSADPDGVPNVYRLDRGNATISRLTNAAFGAFEPSISPDGTRLAFVRYVHEQYQIVVRAMPQGIQVDSLLVSKSEPETWNREPETWDLESRASHPESETFPYQSTGPYRPFPAFLRPRSMVPIVRFEESELSNQDRRLGPGLGLSVGGTDPLRQWAYSLAGFYQENRLWANLSLQNGTHVLRPFVTLSDRPRSTVRPVGGELSRVAYEERSIEVGAGLPVRLSSGGRQSFLSAGASGEYRSIRLIDSDGNSISEFDDRVTVNPFFLLGYGLKANPRDLIPNAGMRLLTQAEVDVRTEDEVAPSRSWRSDATIYLPFFPESGTRVAASLGVLWQNRGSIVDVETFLPRGYRESDVFLGGGTFFKAGLEMIQPVAWIDRGIVVIPVTIQSIYLYGFGEAIGKSIEWTNRRSSIGAGLGVRTLLAHHLGIELRIGVARLLEESDWALTGR